VFGISLTEVAMIAVVALVVVGPQKLPGMLRTLGEWVRRIRQMTTQVRAQTGIDDILRQEGIDGGLAELRGLVRGDLSGLSRAKRSYDVDDDPYEKAADIDQFREYPPEGVDSAGAVPDDLVDDDDDDELRAARPGVDRAAGERSSTRSEGDADAPKLTSGDDAEASNPTSADDAQAPKPTPTDDAEASKPTPAEGDTSQPSPAPWETDRDS